MTQCLIVDASPGERRHLARLMSRYGFDLAASANPEDALDHCRRTAPDVILLADRPGEFDAVRFIRRLRKLAIERQPIVFVCAEEGDAENIGRAIWAGATDCLVKPFDAALLDDKLRMTGLV